MHLLCAKALQTVLGESFIHTRAIFRCTRHTKNVFRGFVPKLTMIDVFQTLLGYELFPTVILARLVSSIRSLQQTWRFKPYAFTTKSLYVGHTDYKYIRWQVGFMVRLTMSLKHSRISSGFIIIRMLKCLQY